MTASAVNASPCVFCVCVIIAKCGPGMITKVFESISEGVHTDCGQIFVNTIRHDTTMKDAIRKLNRFVVDIEKKKKRGLKKIA